LIGLVLLWCRLMGGLRTARR